jgi:acetyltransferase-like isoleucine patch superfamily enzyme
MHSTAHLGKGTTLGRYCVIEANSFIGKNCALGNHVVIHAESRIGDNVRIDDNVVVGKQPARAKRSIFRDKDKPKIPPATVGQNCIIGAQAVIYAGSALADDVFVADLATVRENVTIGNNTIVGRNVTIENFCTIGSKCKLETNCYITAYSTIEDFCFIAPMVTTTNDNYLGRTKERFKHFKGVMVRRGGRIGAGAVILPGIEIGEDAVVGAGAVVTKNVPARTVVVGVPAKYFGKTPKAQLLENQDWR